VARGAAAQPDEMLAQLQDEIRRAAETIRALSAAERNKRGINPERGEVSVAYVIESFIVAHAEEHLAQVKGALRR
jgi:hypothetical protein